MKQNPGPTDNASADMNPKDRDFQRIDGDVDRISASEKEQKAEFEKISGSVNPADRDFERKQNDVDDVSASERYSEQKNIEEKGDSE